MHLEEFIERIEKVLGPEFEIVLDLAAKRPWFIVRTKTDKGHVFSIYLVHIANMREDESHWYEDKILLDFEAARIRERKLRRQQLAP